MVKGRELIDQTNCPWILTNLLEIDKEMRPILGLQPFHVMEHQGFKIGFLGFAEEGWLDLLGSDIDVNNICYVDYNESLRKYSEILKKEHRCDLVIALNHMRIPQDKDMAEQNTCVDMIFGGHDHCYYSALNPSTDVFVLKSGTDFECFTNLTVLFGVE